MPSRPEDHHAKPWETRCDAFTKVTLYAPERRRCVRPAVAQAGGGNYCTLHERKYRHRELVLALLCAENIEAWDVARRAGVRELVAESR